MWHATAVPLWGRRRTPLLLREVGLRVHIEAGHDVPMLVPDRDHERRPQVATATDPVW